MALLSLVLGSIVGVLIALTPLQPSAPLGGSPYLDLLQHYRDGKYEVAVKGLAQLSEGRDKDRVFDALESLVPTIDGLNQKASRAGQLSAANIWAIAFPAAAALHLETGYALMKAGDFPAARDHLQIAHQIVDYSRFLRIMKMRPDLIRDHLQIAHQIVDYSRFLRIMKMRPDLQEQQARLRRDIHLGVIWTLQIDPLTGRLTQQLEHVRGEFPGDGEIALAIGVFEEYQSSSVVVRTTKAPTTAMAGTSWRHGAQQMRLKSAEKYYRDALKFDASVIEARVRLGRVLQQRGLFADARIELERVFAQPNAPHVLRYLASMFLVDVLDALGQTAASFARARDLATRYRECQSAHLALSSAYEARGQRAEALAALAPLWKEETSRDCVDPWWSYYTGQTWRIPALFGSLRERVGGAK